MPKQKNYVHDSDDPAGNNVAITTVVIPDFLDGEPDLEDAFCEIEMRKIGAVNHEAVTGNLPPRADRAFWKRNPGGKIVVDAAKKAAAGV